MNIETTFYEKQKQSWPLSGRHILAQYNENFIIVYQAYGQSIGSFALEHEYFGGDFKLDRMSWIKTNFLWMMHRSRWGTKPSQQIVLAVRLKLDFFNSVLKQAVPSSFDPDLYEDNNAWRTALSNSQVRVQWDPDYDPSDVKLFRRAIQLGLKGEILKEYAKDAIIEIIDMSDFINTEKKKLKSKKISELLIPKEVVYMPNDEEIIKNLKLSPI